MLEIPYNGTIYLVVDALDECATQLSDLLSFIANDKFASPSRVKWLITSRHREDIERKLGLKNPCVSLEEEVNSSRISCAVESYIHIKVQELVQGDGYEDVREEASSYIKEKAGGTFLWVALACKMVEDVLPYKLLPALKKIPQGLDSIYDRMMGQILNLRDSDDVKNCKCIIVSTILAHRPLHLKELAAITDLPEKLRKDVPSLEKLVRRGSFLTIQGGTVYFVHQSAKDFFTTGNGSKIFSSSRQEEHGKIAYWSLDFMSSILQEDICDLQKPGVFAAEAQRRFSQSRFTHIEYACCYWVDHLAVYLTNASRDKHDQLSPFDNGRKVKMFLREHFLHWLEALSLLGKVSDGVLTFKRLKSLIDVSL